MSTILKKAVDLAEAKPSGSCCKSKANASNCVVPPIVDVTPVGTLVLVEVLTANEVMGTSLTLSSKTETNNYQGYILEVGPRVPAEQGLKKGQRVFLSGNSVPTPDHGNYKQRDGGRLRAMFEYNAIKGVCVEKE